MVIMTQIPMSDADVYYSAGSAFGGGDGGCASAGSADGRGAGW